MKTYLAIIMSIGMIPLTWSISPPNIAVNNTSVNLNCPQNKTRDIDKTTLKWYLNSTEKIALYQQTYNIANSYVQNKLEYLSIESHQWGVILDIDETVLDNSWFERQCNTVPIDENDFSKYIVLKQKSQALPGAKRFTCNVQKSGGYVTLISNRDGSYHGTLQATINNLKSQGICFDQVILSNYKTDPNPLDKNPRFIAVQNGTCKNNLMVCSNTLPKHVIIAYLGDNIQDFPKLQQQTMNHKTTDDPSYLNFGDAYFIMPNPLYGSWIDNNFH